MQTNLLFVLLMKKEFRVVLMDVRTGLIVLFWCCLSLRHNGVEGRREEEIGLEREFNLYNNKPAVITIQTKYGDTYNCVDFYKQPAFDHPSLQNHTHHFQMNSKPSLFYPKEKNNKEASVLFDAKSIWVNGKGCPPGTVPIKKYTKEEFINAKLATKIYGSKIGVQTTENPGLHYAVVHTNSIGPFNGGFMVSSLYNPQAVGSQFSASHLKIQSAPESVEVGWMVNPSLYKDNQTRLFVYTKTEHSQCFDALCPGIVVVRADIPLDMVLKPTSTRGSEGKRYSVDFFIYKDAANGAWYLVLGDDKVVGYWPEKIFTALAKLGNYVEWGGEVFSPPNVPSPPMGAGDSRLYGVPTQDAYCRAIQIVDENHKLVDASDTKEYTDINTYQVWDRGYSGDFYRHIFFFGGLGGYTGI